ncbi:MAG: helix-turn-helix domain-containing protein [Thaumarchaeota archaeon]|nr:helix-turn-helix domain-containing protein [Nitrososphaerota archaeon]
MAYVLEDKKEGKREKDTDILKLMSDEYMRKIVVTALSAAKSVEEISRENGIPISTCYRRVRELVDMGILREQSIVLNDEGKKYQTYASELKEARINFSSKGLTVETTFLPREPSRQYVVMPTRNVGRRLPSRHLSYGSCFSCKRHSDFPGIPAVTLHRDNICVICKTPSTSLL